MKLQDRGKSEWKTPFPPYAIDLTQPVAFPPSSLSSWTGFVSMHTSSVLDTNVYSKCFFSTHTNDLTSFMLFYYAAIWHNTILTSLIPCSVDRVRGPSKPALVPWGRTRTNTRAGIRRLSQWVLVLVGRWRRTTVQPYMAAAVNKFTMLKHVYREKPQHCFQVDPGVMGQSAIAWVASA